MKHGTRILAMTGPENTPVVGTYINPVGEDYHLIRVFGEFRTGPSDEGLREVRVDQFITEVILQ